MGQTPILVFAYGSNMSLARIRARCPSAKVRGVAELGGHELRWHKSSKDGSGKCDIVSNPASDMTVFGVLYEIQGDDKAALDRAEGKGFGYEEIDIEVLLGAEKVAAKAYRATNTNPALRPYSWYRALVIAGAREHGLPAPYLAHLEAIVADEDPDRERHGENMRLIAEARA
jgi:gamma-glutamylcyclotransferase